MRHPHPEQAVGVPTTARLPPKGHRAKRNKELNIGRADEGLHENSIGAEYKLPLDPTSEAVKKYCAAFPALGKGQHSPMQYFLAPPAWCRKPTDAQKEAQDWTQAKNRRCGGKKERRNSYQGQKKNNNSKRRCNSYNRAHETKENLPEWVTHEASWDMDVNTQNPIRDFLKELHRDEGYHTTENTFVEDLLLPRNMTTYVPDQPEAINDVFGSRAWVMDDMFSSPVKTPAEEEMYAKFEAKFDRLEALWSNDRANTPDDECQELPVDFQELLSSPSDRALQCSSMEKCGPIPLNDTIWSSTQTFPPVKPLNSFGKYRFGGFPYIGIEKMVDKECMEVLYDKLRPLNLKDDFAQENNPWLDCHASGLIQPDPSIWAEESDEPTSLYGCEDVLAAVPNLTSVMRSLTALNHSKRDSSFTEVLPKLPSGNVGDGRTRRGVPRDNKPIRAQTEDGEDLLTSERTHFKPIKKEAPVITVEDEPVNIPDGTTFPIDGNMDDITFQRSKSGSMFLETALLPLEQYMEFRSPGINYSRLKLTLEQTEASHHDMDDYSFTLKFRVTQTDKSVQTLDCDAYPPLRRDMFQYCRALALAVEDEFDEDAFEEMAFHSSPEEERAQRRLALEEVISQPILAIGEEKSHRMLAVEREISQRILAVDNYWKKCKECEAKNAWTNFESETDSAGMNLRKIWSSGENSICAACTDREQHNQTSDAVRAARDETSKDWEELLSDISYVHDFYTGDEHPPELASQLASTAGDETDTGCESAGDTPVDIEEASVVEVQSVECWRQERKRRHSATQGWGAGGKLAARAWPCCARPHDVPFLACCERPLTR